MSKGQLISEEAAENLQAALSKNEHWMAYNTRCYFLGKDDIFFFDNHDEAEEFALHNISDYDSFRVIKVSTVEDALQQISNTYLITNNNSIMNEKNYEYLTEQLKRTGFGDTLNDELRNNMEKQNPEFTLNLQKSYGSDNVSATLHFKKSDQSDMIFFNSYDLQLKKENNENAIQQTFYPNKGITLKEGYNLLDGRAVHKTLTNKQDEKYTAWLQLDFKNVTQSGNYEMKQYHQNYGYDLGKTLSKYPIQELNNEKFKESLIRSLERGNLQSATLLLDGKEEKIFVTPNLAFKSLTAYNSQMYKVSLSALVQKNSVEQKHENRQEVSETQEVKKEAKIKNNEEPPTQKKSKKQKIA